MSGGWTRGCNCPDCQDEQARIDMLREAYLVCVDLARKRAERLDLEDALIAEVRQQWVELVDECPPDAFTILSVYENARGYYAAIIKGIEALAASPKREQLRADRATIGYWVGTVRNIAADMERLGDAR